MGIFATIITFVVKRFWPWFKDFVWPSVKNHVKELIFFILEKLKGQFKEWFSNKSKKREQEAQSKAEEAESKAQSSSNEADVEKYRAVAQVWREVAEQLRRDNEELKAKLDELVKEAKYASESLVEDIELDLDFSKDKPILKIGEKVQEMPALPQ